MVVSRKSCRVGHPHTAPRPTRAPNWPMNSLCMLVGLSLQSAAAFGPPMHAVLPQASRIDRQSAPAAAPASLQGRTRSSRRIFMLKRSRRVNGKWIKEEVPDEAVNYTIRRLVIAQALALVPIALALASGKTIDQFNAPGYAEASAKKAEKKAAYLADVQARKDELTARAAADKAAGRAATPPPKPWERAAAIE